MVVGIMIVVPIKYWVDTEMENQYIHTNTVNIKVGSTTEKLNGSKIWV